MTGCRFPISIRGIEDAYFKRGGEESIRRTNTYPCRMHNINKEEEMRALVNRSTINYIMYNTHTYINYYYY